MPSERRMRRWCFVWSKKSSGLEKKTQTHLETDIAPAQKTQATTKILGGGNSNIFLSFTPDFVGFHDPI